MKRKMAVTLGACALALIGLAAAPPGGGTSPIGAMASAQAAVSKSLGEGGGGGNISGAADRLGDLLSTGAPVIVAVAGYFVISTLASRNIGSFVGVILITLIGLIFLLSPQSIETMAKGIANTVF